MQDTLLVRRRSVGSGSEESRSIVFRRGCDLRVLGVMWEMAGGASVFRSGLVWGGRVVCLELRPDDVYINRAECLFHHGQFHSERGLPLYTEDR